MTDAAATSPQHYEAHPPVFANQPLGTVLAVLLIPAFGLGLLILLYWYLQSKSTKVVIADGNILWEEGLLSKTRTELQADHVRTVSVGQSFWQRIFGVGDVRIYTAGDHPEMVLAGMPRPEELRAVIKSYAN